MSPSAEAQPEALWYRCNGNMNYPVRAWLALLLVFVWACSTDPSDAPECRQSSDCDGALLCVDGQCLRPCNSELDCSQIQPMCLAGVCRPTECGNGIVEIGEACDGNCPSACNDGIACTRDTLMGNMATCGSVCIFAGIIACSSGDGCCPAGCTDVSDADCSATCGDGVVDPGETCDDNCPASCIDGNACTTDLLTGSVAGCSAACSYSPVTTCQGGDGCCPPGCGALADVDCSASCGNDVVEPGELCDGDCPESCDDTNVCTYDSLTGTVLSCSASCSFAPIASCEAGDGCCPAGCNTFTDGDCSASCGNDVVEPPESCDGNCPSTCDDGDVCTIDNLVGSVDNCSAACSSNVITACGHGDGCCPGGCHLGNDDDCPVEAIDIPAAGFWHASSSELERKPGTSVSQTTFTYATWYKSTTEEAIHFGSGVGSSNHTFFWAGSSDGRLMFQHQSGGSSVVAAPDLGVDWPYLDVWVHLVFALDSTQALPEERARWWINGVEYPVTDLSTNPVSQDFTSHFGSEVTHAIGNKWSGGFNWRGLLAQTFIIWGHALEASAFITLEAPDAPGEVRSIIYRGPVTAESVYFDYTVPGTNGFAAQPDWNNTNVDTKTNDLPY